MSDTFLFFAALTAGALFVGWLVDYCLYLCHLRWLACRAKAMEEDFDY